MPLNLNKLTALAVSRTTKPGYHGDGGGLWLQVAPSRVGDVIPQYVKGASPIKLGRNEPCFCGSGRKYKKCRLTR
jgi:hypothetical protein